jgi:hypothetical protein
MLTTDQKGAITQTAIALAAIKLGIGVSRPLGDERYDLIFDVGEPLICVRCKWARRYGDVIIARCYSARRTADGLRRRTYREDEVDAFAAYCAEIDRGYFLPIECMPSRGTVQLRLGSRATISGRAYAGPIGTSSPLHWGGRKGP